MEPQPEFQTGDTVQIFKQHTGCINWHGSMDKCIGFIFEIKRYQYSKKYKTFCYDCEFEDDFWNIHEESLRLLVRGVSNTNESISDNTNTKISTPCKT